MGISNDDYSDIIKQKQEQQNNSLSTEDQQLREEMLSLIEELKNDDQSIHTIALEKLKKHCQTGSTNLTLLPKYLQFLHDQVETLKSIHEKWGDKYACSGQLCLIISALSILETENNDCLTYRLKGTKDKLEDWGLEYIRHLAEELKTDFENKLAKTNTQNTETQNLSEKVFEQALPLLYEITEFYMKNNCEIDAVDLYIDLDYQERLEEFLSEQNCLKILRYLQQCSNFFMKEDYLETNRFLFNSYLRFNYIIEAFYCACRCLDVEFFHDVLLKVDDSCTVTLSTSLLQKQMCFILGHLGVYYCFSEEHEQETAQNFEELIKIIHNGNLSNAHADLAIEFDILKPLNIEDICKVGNTKYSSYYNSSNLKDPVYTTLASAFCSAFSNAAFKTDNFLSENKWLLVQCDSALMCATACIGILYLWDPDESSLFLDKYLNSTNIYIKSGAILGLGISCTNVHDPSMYAYACLLEYFDHPEFIIRRNAIIAMGLAYAGTDDQDIVDTFREVMMSTNDMPVKAMAALSIGLVAAGSNTPNNINEIFIDFINSAQSASINDPYMRLIPVGLAMVYAGRYESISHQTKDLVNFEGDFGKWCFILIKICSNWGTGNCISLQKLIEFIHDPQKNEEKETIKEEINEIKELEKIFGNDLKNADIKDLNEIIENHVNAQVSVDENLESIADKINVKDFESTPGFEEEIDATVESKVPPPTQETQSQPKSKSKDKKHDIKKLKEETRALELLQGLSTIGVAFICLIEEISQKMALKLFNTFLQFGSLAVRRAVPVALGILSASNPQIAVIELLSKLSHDHDDVISLNAVIALGIVGAGTNNSRVANLLRNLNIYHHNEPLHVFAIRIAQGLLHMSKGTMSLTPLRAEGTFLSPVTLASMLLHGVLSLDVRNTYLSKDPHMLFWLVPAMKFRGLITYDENGKSVPVTVRVGQAVDETGQAGKPKRITGFQTHRTPILLNVGERVELATNKYTSYTPVLENIVIVRENSESSGPDLY